jgi:diguanylate cyclase (GGDEF)-like protein
MDELTGLSTMKRPSELRVGPSGAFAIGLDIANMAWVNDQFGHEAGDRVIATVGKMVQRFATFRSCAAFRVGGDEFLLVFRFASRPDVVTWARGLVNECKKQRMPYRQSDSDRDYVALNAAVFKIEPTDQIGQRALRERISQIIYAHKVQTGLHFGEVAEEERPHSR